MQRASSSGGSSDAATDAATHKITPTVKKQCAMAAVRRAAATPFLLLVFILLPSCLAFVQLAVDRDRRQKLLMGADSGFSAIHKDDLLHLREVVQAV